MKKTNKQQVISYLPLSEVVASDFNPRKKFNELDLQELADSIKQHGVMQPIMVRPLNGVYQIVYGERRYRASQFAEQKTIPVIIKELTDSEAVEYAVTENLQRLDVSPIEESIAYNKLLEGNYTIESLGIKFGKSISYIRNRVRLNDLIESFNEMLEDDTLNITVAIEFSKFSKEIQQEIFDEHYAEGIAYYKEWNNLKAKNIIEYLTKNYSAKIADFNFDTNGCKNCQYNSITGELFDDGSGRCTNIGCMKKNNNQWMVNEIQKLKEAKPHLYIGMREYRQNIEVLAILEEQGEEVFVNSWFAGYPSEPNLNDGADEKEVESYNIEVEEYSQRLSEIAESSKEYVIIDNDRLTFGYLENNENVASKENQTPLEKLEARDAQYLDLKHRKITDEISTLVKKVDTNKQPFAAFEEDMVYFAMAECLGKKELELLGFEDAWHLSSEKKMELINNLTDQKKDIIRRAFILQKFNGAAGQNEQAKLLLKFAEYHVPSEVASIHKIYDAEYDKRHTAIAKKIAAL